MIRFMESHKHTLIDNIFRENNFRLMDKIKDETKETESG
jgi:hypothetical protein